MAGISQQNSETQPATRRLTCVGAHLCNGAAAATTVAVLDPVEHVQPANTSVLVVVQAQQAQPPTQTIRNKNKSLLHGCCCPRGGCGRSPRSMVQ